MNTGNVAVSVTPTVQNAAYSSGNVMGGLLTVPFFVSDALPSGVIDTIAIYSKGGSTVAMTIYVFDTLPAASTFTDKSAMSLNAADVAKLAMPPFVLTPAVVGAGTTVSSASLVQATSVRNKDTTPSQNLYVAIVAGGSVTPASVSDLVLKMSGALD